MAQTQTAARQYAGSLTNVTISNVPYNSVYYSTTVVNASVKTTSKIRVDWGNVLDADENSPEMDHIKFLAIPGTGSFELRMFSMDCSSKLGGSYKLSYLIQ